MGSVFIEPLNTENTGEVFVSHVAQDEQRVRNTLLRNFEYEGIPYFLSGEDIEPGEDWIKRIENAANRADCGVIALTENSLDSEWVWYEAGILQGLDKTTYPFILDDINIGDLPEFVSRRQATQEISSLLEILQEEIREFGDVAEQSGFEQKDLRRVDITITLDTGDYSSDLIDSLSFGYLLVGFGRPDETDPSGRGRAARLMEPILTDSVIKDSRTIKVDYSIPLHTKYGVEFKPFVEVPDQTAVDTVRSMIEDDIFMNPDQSGSGERQRVYFLLPIDVHDSDNLSKSDNIVNDGRGHLNNWLHPQ